MYTTEISLWASMFKLAYELAVKKFQYKFKLQMDDGEEKVVRIDKRFTSYRQKIAGIDTVIYECQSVIDGIEKRHKLKYILSDCRWQLYAI